MSQLSQASVKAIFGEDYLSPDLKTSELIARLKKLHKFLKGLESASDTDQQKLDNISAALVQEDILNHENADVRLLVACCLTDIIKIYVPDAPYDDTQLEAVFSLFIKELRGLENITDKSFTLRYYLLENLEAVKAFNLLIDLNNDALFVDLFKAFFESIAEEHSVAVVTCMMDIMQTCLTESEEISQQLLDMILSNLLPETKKEHSAAYKLAQQLIKACSKLLQPVITQFLNSIISDVKALESELKDKAHVLIWELNRADPDLLLYVLPELEKELSVDILDKRKAAVKLLTRMFSAKDSTLHQSYPMLFATFMGRFNDVDTSIRCLMLSSAPSFATNHPACIKDILAALYKRIRDSEEDPRLAAVDTICKMAQANPDLVPKDLLLEAGVRMRDKKPEIRKAALFKLSELYGSLLQTWGMPSQWDEKHAKAYGWIPTKVMHVIYQNDPDLRVAVDDALDHYILPEAYDIKKRTEVLLEVRSTMDKNAADAVVKLLKDKQSFQDDFLNFLAIRKQLQKKPNDNALKAELATRITSLASKLPGGNTKFHKLQNMKSVACWKALATLATHDLDYAKSRKAATEALETMHKKSKEGKTGEYLKKVVQKLSLTIVTKQTVPFLFAALKSALPEESSVGISILSFTEEISTIHPSFFASSFTHLYRLLENDDSLIVDKTLKIVSNVGQNQLEESAGDVAKNLKKRLCQLCTSGTPTQAKWSIKALSKIYPEKSDLFSKIAKEVAPHLQLKDKACPTALQALSQIAKADPAVFSKFEDKSLAFVIDTVLPGTRGAKGSRQALELCKWQMIGMELLVHYLEAQQDESENEDVLETARKIIRLFLDVLETHKGESSKDNNASEAEYLRQCASTSLLKLARHKGYETLLTEDDFHKVAYIVMDPCLEVRAAVVNAAYKGLVSLKLPLKYMIMLVLCATDPEKKTIVAKARQSLAVNIKMRRQVWDSMNKDILSKEKKSNFGILPEYVLPYLIHFLAHRDDWESDVPEYKVSTRYLVFFFEQLHLGDNVSFLHSLLSFMKQTQDAQEPPLEENIRVLCDIALLYINTRATSKGKLNQTTYPGNLYLPPSLFRVTEDDSVLQKEMAEGGKSYLPPNFTLPNAKKEKIFNKEAPSPVPDKTGGKRKAQTSPTKSPNKRAKKAGDDDAFVGASKKESDSPRRTSLSRKAKEGAASMRDQESDDEEESDQAQQKKAASKRKAASKAKTKAKPPKKRKASEEENEEEHIPKRSAKRSQKGKAKKGETPEKDSGEEKEEEQVEMEKDRPATRTRHKKGKAVDSPEPAKTHTVRRAAKKRTGK